MYRGVHRRRRQAGRGEIGGHRSKGTGRVRERLGRNVGGWLELFDERVSSNVQRFGCGSTFPRNLDGGIDAFNESDYLLTLSVVLVCHRRKDRIHAKGMTNKFEAQVRTETD